MTDRAATLAEYAAEFLGFEKEFAETHEMSAARVTTRHTLQCIAEDLGVPAAEIEAAIDAAIKTAGAR